MNLHNAKSLLVRDGLTYSRPRLAWLPSNLYRSLREAKKHIRKNK